MPSPPLANTFNGGSDGVTIDTSNSGGSSGDIFTVVLSAKPTFTNVQKHSGGIGMRIVDPTTPPNVVGWDALGSLTTDLYIRWYMYLASLPPDNNFYPLAIRTSADAASGLIRVLADGSINTRDASNSQISFIVGPIATAQWIRLEVRIKSSTTVGEMDCRLYNDADSSTITESCTGTNAVLGANSDKVYLGTTTATPASMTAYYDDFAVSTAGWIGPTQAGKVAPIAALSGVGW